MHVTNLECKFIYVTLKVTAIKLCKHGIDARVLDVNVNGFQKRQGNFQSSKQLGSLFVIRTFPFLIGQVSTIIIRIFIL